MNCRLKFASSSDSDQEMDTSFAVEYFDSDPDLPIISKLDHGYPVHLLIQKLLSSDINNAYICKVQPLGVMKNAIFQVDLDVVPFSDLKADDLGSWNATGTKRTYFRFTQGNSIRYATGVPSTSTSYFCLTRRYYVHKTYNRFHRIISDIKGMLVEISLTGIDCSWVLNAYFVTVHEVVPTYKFTRQNTFYVLEQRARSNNREIKPSVGYYMPTSCVIHIWLHLLCVKLLG